MDEFNAEKVNNNQSAPGYSKDETTSTIKFVSKEDEKIMLHDISKATIAGMQSIDVVREYVENMDFKNYIDRLNQDYARISERCSKYMSAHGVASDFFGSVRQAFQRNAVKISMLTSSSDSKIAEHMLKGTNMAIDVVSKNFNGSNATLSPDLIALAKDFQQILENSLSEFRKYLMSRYTH
ncbi:MAG: hypothetical protein EOM87_01195 [Clostridia bacterium]|nr:hypothetical protein [Clostridia bacterium]